MTTTAQPYAECQDCDLTFPDRDAMSAHLSATLAPTGEAGVIARGHRAQVVNPTDEERRASRVRLAISDALNKACEELWDDVERGYFTAGEVTAEMWAYDLDSAWEEYVKGSEDDD